MGTESFNAPTPQKVDGVEKENSAFTPENVKDMEDFKALQDEMDSLIKKRERLTNQPYPEDRETPESIEDKIISNFTKLGELRDKLEKGGIHPKTMEEQDLDDAKLKKEGWTDSFLKFRRGTMDIQF
jgi:hypothetical protein